AAKRFSHKFLLNPMADGRDNLDNLHANTQVPKAVGFQRIAELRGDEKYAEAGQFFWETVTSNRSLAFGGNSRREHFPAASACSDYVVDVEGPESCNTHNMLKLTEGLFRVSPQGRFADYYERALFNHILPTQHPEHGGYVYFTPARPRHYRVYSAPNEGMWCCVGTGMENHGKYNEFIYTHQNNALYLNLFVASELNWKEKGIQLRQETSFPMEEKTRLQVTDGSAQFDLNIRYPGWVEDGELKVTVNGNDFPVKKTPSSYISVERNWQKGDVVEINFPMQNRLEQLPNVPNYYAFMHGPILLAAKTGMQDLAGLVADDSRWGHIAHGERLPVDEAPVIIADDISEISEHLEPVENSPFTLKLSGLKMLNAEEIVLEPFFGIHDARYSMYWMVLTSTGYQAHLDSIARVEKEMLELQKRTVDFVAPGEQQPEADHAMKTENSNSGNNWDEFYREARNGGFFSYRLATGGEKNLELKVRYWGFEWGSRKFDIFIDNKKLVTEDNTGRWNQSAFQDVVYEIPVSMVEGKDFIRVKFQAHEGSTAGGVYYIRLLKK
ncbi:MAG: beta-L-arabinofuranosidase domain-containing protein, partial [Tangfeifania sp.]